MHQYTAISEKVKAQGQLDNFTQYLQFLQGLLEKLQKLVIKNLKIDTDEPSTFDQEKILEETNKLILNREQSDHLVTISAPSGSHDGYLDPQALNNAYRLINLMSQNASYPDGSTSRANSQQSIQYQFTKPHKDAQ